eukprot:TRINITY_DN769_c0_g1_i1.p1 TRINITY_DN769_c0_g1~~TRINITY_DN769_c0_g1_i1.p1  ORF type:complete len:327 (-),score=69.72 TRINITY_DN769_c0_g1_i1:41-1021(-)
MSITPEQAPQVKKRGRPRKNSLPTAGVSSPSSASPASPYQNGHYNLTIPQPLNKGHISNILNDPTTTLNIQPSPSIPNGTHTTNSPVKKRGRPRKNDPNAITKKENQLKSRRVSSRTKHSSNGIIEPSSLSNILNSPQANQMTLLAFAAAEISEPDSPRKKRGRPRRREYTPSPSSSRSRSRSSSGSRSRSPVQVPVAAQPQEKRKRGRPRKYFPAPNEVAKPKGPPKKKGRKPKTEIPTLPTLPVAMPTATNGKEVSDELLYYKIVTTERSPGKRKIKPYDGIVGEGDNSRVSDSDGEDSPDTDFEESSEEESEEDSDSGDDDFE